MKNYRFWLLDLGLLCLILAPIIDDARPSHFETATFAILFVLRILLHFAARKNQPHLEWIFRKEWRWNLYCLVGFGITICLTAFFYPKTSAASVFLSAFPFVLPWPFLISRMISHGLRKEAITWCSEKAFVALKKLDLLVLHQIGVFSSEKINVREVWLDSDPQNVPQVYQSLLSQLNTFSSHPFAQALSEKHSQEARKDLVHVQSVEPMKDMGWTIQFRDTNQQLRTVRLGTLAWHRILGHEIDADGRQKLVAWKRRGLLALALSDGTRIVACFAFNSDVSPDHESVIEDLRKLGIHCGLISSAPLSDGERIQKVFDRTATLLSSLERRCVLQQWYERFPHNLEIVSAWDDTPKLASMKAQFLPAPPTEPSPTPFDLCLVDLRGTRSAITASKRCYWHSRLLVAGLIIVASLSSTWMIFPSLAYFGALTLASRLK